MVITGVIVGIAESTNRFHEALLTETEPVEMDWQTLVENGTNGNDYVRLIDVDVVEPMAPTEFEEELLEAFESGPFIRQDVVDMMRPPAKVVPRGANEDKVPDAIVIPSRHDLLDEAYAQLDETATLTGTVSLSTHDELVNDMASMVWLGGPPVVLDDDVYRFTPLSSETDLSNARSMFLFTGLLVSLGLIICGSGGPGIWTCWYAPIPSLISLIGYPMRYGRGSKTVRAAYFVVGAFIMAVGYKVMVMDGGLGTGAGSPLLMAKGYCYFFIGLGGVLAVPIQSTVRALSDSTECVSSKKKVRMSWNQACGMEPVEMEVEYEDQMLASAGSLPLLGALSEKADALAANGFSKPESMQWQRESGLTAAAVQLGCQQMVVSDLESNDKTDLVESCLVSVLGTGMPMLTVSANHGSSQNRRTINARYQRASTSDPSEMLAEHLEYVLAEAEQSDSYIVEIQRDEIQDVVQLARRALAEIQGTVNGIQVKVGSKTYGRFQYPPVPIPVKSAEAPVDETPAMV